MVARMLISSVVFSAALMLSGCGGGAPGGNGGSGSALPPANTDKAPAGGNTTPPKQEQGGGPAKAEGTGIKGVVKLKGEAPAVKMVALQDFQQQQCQCKEVPSDVVSVDKDSKGIQWCVIRLDGVKLKDPEKPFEPPTIDQKGCRFLPHAVIVAPGGTLTLLNPDKIPHTFHTIPQDLTNPSENVMVMEEKSSMAAKLFMSPEIVLVDCAAHPWMKAVVAVHDPRAAAISGKDGSFAIKDLPPGKYKGTVYHSELGEKKIEVEVKDGQMTDLGTIEYEAKGK